MQASIAPQRSVTTIIIASLMIILGLFTFCGSIILIAGGGVLGALGSTPGFSAALATSVATNSAGADPATIQQAQDALNAASKVGGITIIGGILSLIIGIAYLITGIGLFQLRPWAYNATIAISILYIVISIGTALIGGTFSVVTLVFPILTIIMLVFLLTDAGTKRSFGRA